MAKTTATAIEILTRFSFSTTIEYQNHTSMQHFQECEKHEYID